MESTSRKLNNSIHIQNDIKDPIVAQLKMRSTKRLAKNTIVT